MTSNKQSDQKYLGLAAMAFGIGMILFDSFTGTFHLRLNYIPRLILYAPLLILSIWGLMQVLTNMFPETLGSSISPRINRHTFHLPREGRFFLIMMVLVFIAAMMGRNNMLMLVFSLMVGPFVINGWITFMMLKKLKVKRELPRMVMAGSTFSVEVHIQNTRWLIPSFLLAARDSVRSKEEILRPEILFARIPTRQERHTPYQLQLSHRGIYYFGPLEVTTRFPLGFVERGYIIDSPDSIIIHPRIGHLSPYWKREVRKNQHSEMQLRRQTGSFEDEFHHIREYRNGDDPRSIHWRTSARQNELMVKEYRQSRDRDMVILVDFWSSQKPTPEEKLLQEHAISLAATIALDQVRHTGENSLQIFLEGNKSFRWMMQEGLGATPSVLEFFATAEAGAAQGSAQMLKSACQHRFSQNRVILVSTRPSVKNYFQETDLQGAFQQLSSTCDGLQVIDPDPNITATYFQYV